MCAVTKLIEVFRTTTCVITTGPSGPRAGKEVTPVPQYIGRYVKPIWNLRDVRLCTPHCLSPPPLWIFITSFGHVLTKLAEPIQVTVGWWISDVGCHFRIDLESVKELLFCILIIQLTSSNEFWDIIPIKLKNKGVICI